MLQVNGNYRKSTSIITSLIFFIISLTISAKSISVGKSYKFKSIRTAIENAFAGDTLFIYPGVYKESPIILNKSLTLLGINFPVISGEGKYEILRITSNNVKIQGIKFIDAGLSFVDDNAALKLEDVENCSIENNRFENNFFSIYLAKSRDCRIEQNSITASQTTETRSGNGIHLWYCKNISIIKNDISGHRDGIYFEFVTSSKIRGNKCYENIRYGLHFMFSDSCVYKNNTFSKNGAGVAVMFTHFVKMIGNNFVNNWGASSFGLLLKEISDAEISDNKFLNNSTGIYFEGCNRINTKKNIFKENGWAIRMMANSYQLSFSRNNFISNTFDVSTNSIKNTNKFSENYWSNYKGYDLNRDGFGDVPFRPVRLFSYIVEKNRPTLILIRSLFVDLINYAESIFPNLTPETLVDNKPVMKRIL